MIVICIIIAVIGSFICTLIKVKINEWLDDLNMNRYSRLSLKRMRYNEPHATNDVPVEISDDESVELPSVEQNSIEQEKHTNIKNHEVVDILNNAANTLNSEYMHDISSSDEDIIIVNDVPKTSRKSQSMFNWNNTNVWNGSSMLPKNNTSCSSRFKNTPKEVANKQKLMDDLVDDEDFVDSYNFKKEASPPKVTIQYEKIIAGTKVKFPAEPYSCQLAVMNRLISGCNKQQHSLLESPTGSGKTLALLCGALAWQEQYSEKIHREEMNGEGMDAESSCCGNSFGNDSLDDNFFLNSSQYFDEEWCDKVLKKSKAQKVPKVYYGTRTHKQIEQVIREFKKTAYKYKRMTILSSRDRTCIQKTNKNKTELCNELLDPLTPYKTCKYYNELNKKDMVFNDLQTPWDIEDLILYGKEIAVCPYFGARSLMTEAEIIFCPYNYILDPNIRESMKINLKGDIVILDEAHNIEDICREAAGVSLRDDDLAIAANECRTLSNAFKHNFTSKYDFYITIKTYLDDFIKFLKNIDVKDNGSNMISDCRPGVEFLELLHINNIGRSRFLTFHAASKVVIQDFETAMKNESRREIEDIISRDTKKILEFLCFAMQMITSDVFVNDYRVYVKETVELGKLVTGDNWIWKENCKIRTMKLICMNPAIVFAPLARTVHSVILASGTLAPIKSFESELGTQFFTINPDHIVPQEQVYVRCIPRGPNGKTLIANYENVNSWNFQDELGNLILQVCDAVPYGVLCFFPSYNLMNKLRDRWNSTGTWSKLSKLKQIFEEPKESNKLGEIMQEYREVIEESSSKSFRVASGAILFAVCRGKVAEGIDFSDNEARCVLTIGIPYSYKNDPDVSMKMKYNDSNISKGLLSGSEWYTINAFRALNQALGRCIRHKKDWGAILLVDERLQKPENSSHLPKWIKAKYLHDDNYDLQTELEDFVAIQVARERGEDCRSRKT